MKFEAATTSGASTLRPVMEPTGGAEAARAWPDAVWIGQLDLEDLPDTGVVRLAGGVGYSRARILVWSVDRPVAFVEADVHDGYVSVDDVRAGLGELPPVTETDSAARPVSIVICTMNRPDHLREVLGSLRYLDYPEYEVIVVDNDPSSGLTPPVVAEFDGMRIVDAPERGLSKARNVGLGAATHDLVAFTDDDVVIDHRWLHRLNEGFDASTDVVLVSGLVPTGELSTPAQAYFDRRVSWSKNLGRATYSMATPPAEDPLFPFQVGRFGTGANFAVRRREIVELGGFDEGLGVGSPAGGGEDIEMFVRVLLAGRSLVVEPAAVVWHRHRVDSTGLAKQIRDYGIGLGAWLTMLAVRPRTASMLARRAVRGITHFSSVSVPGADRDDLGPDLAALPRTERRAVLGGPLALARSRWAGNRARPLTPGTGLEPLVGIALAASSFGFVAALLGPGGVAVGVALAVFVLTGPGAAILSFTPNLPRYMLAATVPTVGLAVVAVSTVLSVSTGNYRPVRDLLLLCVATAGLATVRAVVVRMRGRRR
ncbi:glycosyltransferase family 2 protein [Prescottella subtropica]|uniref:glycosyltransferase family 2 protein n=1 Tax=Prescottella subtropica TaxID=2545757 RepID=UPI0010F5D7E3|nr:glycosyltransferase [Prescottella subtropica]